MTSAENAAKENIATLAKHLFVLSAQFSLCSWDRHPRQALALRELLPGVPSGPAPPHLGLQRAPSADGLTSLPRDGRAAAASFESSDAPFLCGRRPGRRPLRGKASATGLRAAVTGPRGRGTSTRGAQSSGSGFAESRGPGPRPRP